VNCFSCSLPGALPYQLSKIQRDKGPNSLIASIGERRKATRSGKRARAEKERPAAARMNNRKPWAKTAKTHELFEPQWFNSTKEAGNQSDSATSARTKCKFSRPPGASP
jgi:hypothetical protein